MTRSREIEQLKDYVQTLEANTINTEPATRQQEAFPISSGSQSAQHRFTATQTSATRTGIWIPDVTSGCLRYCNHSSNASVIHRSYTYLTSALENPDMADPFYLASAPSPFDELNGTGYQGLAMTRLKEEYYLNLFWQSYHLFLPILHFETFMDHYRALWTTTDNSLRDDSALVDIVLALCAQYGNCFMGPVGSATSSQPQTSAHESHGLFSHARHLMSTKTESLTIYVVQYHLLSAIYLANISLMNAAHDCIAQALRAALALGLNQKPPSMISEQEKLLRQNIWWSISAMDVRVSLDLGQPFLVHQDETTCLSPHAIKEAETLLPADNLSTSFNGTTSNAFFQNYLDLTIAVKQAHEAFVTHCAVVLEQNDISDWYESAEAIKDCADSLQECIKPVHAWVEQVPKPLKILRRGSGRPFSTIRSPLDIEESIPLWLQRQRVMLELSYHNFLMILYRPFIRFPTSSVGRIPISAEHSVSCLSHAIVTTHIISQVLIESDVLTLVHESVRILWDTTVTLLAFALAHPCCPHSPSARAALQKALSTFDALGSSNIDAARNAAETTRKVLAHIDSAFGSFGTESVSASSIATPRSVVSGNPQGQRSLILPSVAANHDARCAFSTAFTTTSPMDLENLDLLSGLDEDLRNQLLDPMYMSIPPPDQPFIFDEQLLGDF
ncbi:hypothetical protein QM012_005100 [Aureobasidium pullulans]|uniref:Xylanolytic transcriptional activator regulatory domain-containing protein n=1 Tax=Aureobasidium pullulans TaxID=5580 RepID=A0ABR0T652_AURPU